MKVIVTFLILFGTLTVDNLFNQMIGDYSNSSGNDENKFEYNLTLNQDGTFSFHYYSNIKNGIPRENHRYGKGNWTEEKNVISFISDKTDDIDAKHTLDFTNSKARFIIKSPRDKSDKVVKTKLQFLASDIQWLARIEVFKIP